MESSRTKKGWVRRRDVRRRYGDISNMTIWRWLRDPDLGFPQPVRIGGLDFWRESQLDDFDARRSAA